MKIEVEKLYFLYRIYSYRMDGFKILIKFQNHILSVNSKMELVLLFSCCKDLNFVIKKHRASNRLKFIVLSRKLCPFLFDLA